MISLKLLSIVYIRLSQAKDKTNIDIIVLGSLALVIIIGNFHQFPPVVRRSLWTHPIINDEIYSKGVWNQFTSVITLTEQIQKHDNKSF